MKTYRQTLGRWGEKLAASYLEAKGYTLLEHNVRTPYGEIDLIARLEGPGLDQPLAGLVGQPVIVFVEVKTRRSTAYGMPEASITPRKKAHLLSAIQSYRLDHPELQADWRVDVIAIRRFPPGQPDDIVHFENAIQ
jgi:putative endonuclease